MWYSKRDVLDNHFLQQVESVVFLFIKLSLLFSVCKKRTLFDDRPVEIQELTYIIKQDITSLKKQIQQLEDNRTNLQVNTKRDVEKHTTSVVRTLRVR